MEFYKAPITTILGAALLAATAAPAVLADGYRSSRTVIYMTRHAEKQNQLDESGNPICNSNGSRCAEELSEDGLERAELLAEWLEDQRILRRITDVISSDKQRTRQTVQPTAARLIARGVNLIAEDELHMDNLVDGVRQVPAGVANMDGNEITGNSGSVGPTVAAIQALEPGSVALVAAHSGTIYRIMGGEDTDGDASTVTEDGDASVGLGIDTTEGDNFADVTLFPKKESDGKVPTFGDLWKIVINNRTGEARVEWRVNLQQELTLQNQTTNSRRGQRNRIW